MNADAKAKELGLPGITNSVEDVIVARDIILAKDTGAQLHLCHCSTKDSVLMVKVAKEGRCPGVGRSVSASLYAVHGRYERSGYQLQDESATPHKGRRESTA